jgi:23S rRNA (cytosine1962-C5)-methyltransferase
VERLGDDLQISYKQERTRDELLRDLPVWTEEAQWQPARIFTRFLPAKNDDRSVSKLHSGDASLPPTSVVTEANTKYSLDFSAGYSHGLFLDQRANRALVKTLKPQRVLNTFAYTCSFSVVAAMTGAKTTSIDLSKKSLERGQANFTLNGVDPSKHKFIADDVLEAFPRLIKQGEKFDMIILDPPTFSLGNGGRRWQVEAHMEDLVNEILPLAAPKCAILLSTNCTKIDTVWLETTALYAAKLNRRSGHAARTGVLEDFPAPHGSTTLWFHLR